MFIEVVGNFNVDDAIEVIKEELQNKEKSNVSEIKEIIEPTNVNKKELTIKEKIDVEKIALGLKVPIKDLSLKEIELDLYLTMITNILFGSSSEFRERVRKEKILSNMYTEWETLKDFRTFYLESSTTNPDKLLEEIKEEFKNMQLPENAFDRIKKVWIANEVKMIDEITATSYNIYDDILRYNKVIPNRLELIRKMNYEKLKKLVKEINFENISIVKMLSDKK